ncbi:hypothetical protein B0T10DRAFT_463250 [Thelonectria olida]|uniref:Uncharacterized protein n=1 Tax=Thelonectria olida TaxID=1576542 RepID=A0A9P9ALV1_9HYPO|nr:hypothetical protein B0T10DRAFT_463250 [Thelonectria olida]
MAPVSKSKSSSKSEPSGNRRRQKMQRALHAMEQKKNADNEDKIVQLHDMLQKKDEELAALTKQQLDSLDVDMDDLDEPEGEKDAEESKDRKSTKKPKKAIVRSIENPDGGEDSEDNGGLFVSDHETDSDSDSDSDSNSAAFSDAEYGKALYTFPGTKPVKDVKTVGWSGGRFTGYINMYGKKSAARYRLGRFAFPADYEDSQPKHEKVSNPNNRYGDELLDNGKFKYTKRHIRGIFGVAWKGSGVGVSRDDLDCINPDIVQNWRNSPTYVLIAWDIDGEIKKTWETRACLRDRWGKKDADIAIYEAAVEAEGRYMEAKIGKRLAKSRSPSVGLAQGHVRKHREKSLGIKRSSPFRSTPTTRASKSPQPETKTLEELREEFLNDYLELLGAEDFADLPWSEKRECMAAWREEKSLYPAGAAM